MKIFLIIINSFVSILMLIGVFVLLFNINKQGFNSESYSDISDIFLVLAMAMFSFGSGYAAIAYIRKDNISKYEIEKNCI